MLQIYLKIDFLMGVFCTKPLSSNYDVLRYICVTIKVVWAFSHKSLKCDTYFRQENKQTNDKPEFKLQP